MTCSSTSRPKIIARGEETVTLRVPIAFARRGGRKVVVAPDGSANAPETWRRQPRIDNTMVKALARAFRWHRLLDSGAYGSIAELADAEQLNRSYVSRVLRLTLLAPDIVVAILDGRQSEKVTLKVLLEPSPAEWERQRAAFR